MAIVQGNTSVLDGLSTAGTTISLSHTIYNAPNRVLIFAASGRRSSSTFTFGTATFDGVNMYQLYQSSSYYSYTVLGVWYMINPPVKTANISVTATGAIYQSACSVDFSGVNVGGPLFGNTQTQTGSDTLTNTFSTARASNSIVLDILSRANSDLTPTVTSNQTEVNKARSLNGTATNNVWTGISKKSTGVANEVTYWQWGTSARAYCHLAVELKANPEGRNFQGYWFT